MNPRSSKHSDDFNGKAYARGLTHESGVYRMLDKQGRVLYVGKARDLRRRVGSYFSGRAQDTRIATMLDRVDNVEVTVTPTEGAALLMENEQIKALKPRYNILLRDDKSYPYIYVSSEQRYPRMSFHRGARKQAGHYFGPYPSAGSVRESLSLMQKAFRVRQCDDNFFRNRSRPCLQYQIKRCTAPCVGFVDEATYGEDVEHAIRFLQGHSSEVLEELIERMDAAASRQEYESAARYRDQVSILKRMQSQPFHTGTGGDVDVVACAASGGAACVQVFFVRGGRSLGNRAYYPRMPIETDAAGVLDAFLPQYYMERALPAEILLRPDVPERALMQTVFSERAGKQVKLIARPRGERRKWLELAQDNAERALQAYLASRGGMQKRLEALQGLLRLPQIPARMECFDVSHTQGEATVASCVVFGAEGPLKSDYRRFNIRDVAPGDDYGALREALTRRYSRLKAGEGVLPDILFIDGGRGQVSSAKAVLDELQVGGVFLVGVAKGSARRPGDEQLFSPAWRGARRLPLGSPAAHLIQAVRDEAHRFAITGHRQRRGKARRRSVLEDIPGVGPKRRQQLLKEFGGLQGLSRAGAAELRSVAGINQALAERIVAALRDEK